MVMIDMLPTAVPAVLAANATLKRWLAPGAIVAGTAKPAVLKPAPDTVIPLIATAVLPGLVAVTVCEPVLPTEVATEITLGVTARTADVGCGVGLAAEEELTPTQPDAQYDTARRVNRGTRTAPRFKREKFNVDLLSLSSFVFTGAA